MADDDVHGPRRIDLRRCDPRDSRERGSARYQMQKLATGKFHDALNVVAYCTRRRFMFE
jgi:hypothetical protein